jgi:hypothetical protein
MTQAKNRPRPNIRLTAPPVYRIQDSMGRGPYKPGFSQLWTEDRPDSEFEQLKPIYSEFPHFLQKSTPGYHLGVGCLTIEQLQRWITPSEWQTLQNYGYDCCIIQPDRIVEQSNIQCIFECRLPIRSCVKKRIKLYRQ